MRKRILRFLANEDGPTTVEYSIMLALIVMVCFASIVAVGDATNNMFNMVSNEAFNNNGNNGLLP